MSNPVKYKGDFISGKWILPERPDGDFKDISPGDLSDEIMKVTFKHDHVDQACSSAKKAYLSWARLPVDERRRYLLRLKEVFETHKNDLIEAICRDTGKPKWDATTEVGAVIGKIDITLNFSSKLMAEERIANALPGVDGVIRYKSRGVMAVVGIVTGKQIGRAHV